MLSSSFIESLLYSLDLLIQFEIHQVQHNCIIVPGCSRMPISTWSVAGAFGWMGKQVKNWSISAHPGRGLNPWQGCLSRWKTPLQINFSVSKCWVLQYYVLDNILCMCQDLPLLRCTIHHWHTYKNNFQYFHFHLSILTITKTCLTMYEYNIRASPSYCWCIQDSCS